MFKHFSKKNQRENFLNSIMLPNLKSYKKPIKSNIDTETFYAKNCWREVSRFEEKISIWKIVNNSPISMKYFKTKNLVSIQKKNLKKKILKKL